jgi:hypothetical protein
MVKSALLLALAGAGLAATGAGAAGLGGAALAAPLTMAWEPADIMTPAENSVEAWTWSRTWHCQFDSWILQMRVTSRISPAAGKCV